jgi:hypothetical protein
VRCGHVTPCVAEYPSGQLRQLADRDEQPPAKRLGVARVPEHRGGGVQLALNEGVEVASGHVVVDAAELSRPVLDLAHEVLADAAAAAGLDDLGRLGHEPGVDEMGDRLGADRQVGALA